MQQTLSEPVEFEGLGLHSGQSVRCRLEPAPPDSGLTVVVGRATAVPLTIEQVSSTDHATTLKIGETTLQTTEHLLAALYGCGVDNARIVLEGGEVPILDGSALPFARALFPRLEVQDRLRHYLRVTRRFVVVSAERRMTFLPAPDLRLYARIAFDHPAIGEQEGTFAITPESFLREIAPARTFGFLREVEQLRRAGLIRGAGLENALVFDEEGLLNPPQRFPDEPLRHKVLDCVGDLALLGRRLKAEVHVVHGGHGLHYLAARRLLASDCIERTKEA
jgi:UDP-3-O-[3-hydroxymyristoyl] N-acetylglucosamine deacetylase